VQKNRRVLVVDDQRAIHDDFRKILSASQTEELNEMEGALFGDESPRLESFDLDSAYQGDQGVEMVRSALAEERPYALVIVDMRMPPGWNGLTTIEKIWESDPDIQVVICTAYSDSSWEDIRQRFGATDNLLILKKPFDVEEVCQLACAMTEKWRLARQSQADHIQLRCLNKDLQLQKTNLEDIVSARTRDLSEVYARLTIFDKAKLEFLTLISHELRTLLNGLIGVSELILSELEATSGAELRDLFEQSRRRIVSVVEYALLITQIEVAEKDFVPETVSLATMWNLAAKQADDFASTHKVILRRAPLALGLVLGKPELTVRALHALIETAVRFSTEGETIEPACQVTPDFQSLTLDTHGATIPAPHVAKFFDLLSIRESDTAAGDIGLGPAVALRILSLFGGAVTVENREGGIRLTVRFRRPPVL